MNMRLTNEAYNQFKKLVFLWLPGLASFCFSASYVWDMPSVKLIMGMATFTSFFLGVCLTLSSKQYRKSDAAYDGRIVVSVTEDGPKTFSLELQGDPEDLEHKDVVNFKIVLAEPSLEVE